MAKKKKSAKEPQKTFAGMPMNWDWKNWSKNFWNPEEEQIFPPKRVGIGWSLNFHAALKKVGLVK